MRNLSSKINISKKDTGTDESKTNITSKDPVNYQNKSGDKGLDKSHQNIQAGSGSSVTSEKEDVGTDKSEIHTEFHPNTQSSETWENKLQKICNFICPKQKKCEISKEDILLFIKGKWDGKRFPICNGLLDEDQQKMLVGYKEANDKKDKEKLEMLKQEPFSRKCPLTNKQLITRDNIEQFVSNEWTGKTIPGCDGQLPDTIFNSLQEYKTCKTKLKISMIEKERKVREPTRAESNNLINLTKGDTGVDKSTNIVNITNVHGQPQHEFGHIKREFGDVYVDYVVSNIDNSHYVVRNIYNMDDCECDKIISQSTDLYGNSGNKTNTYCAMRSIDIKTDDSASQKHFIREMITDPNYMDVATYITRGGRLPNHDEMYEMLKKLNNLLSHIHTKNIAFGNLKPTNIFINGKNFYSDINLTDPFPPKSSYAECMKIGHKDSFQEFIAPEFLDGSPNNVTMDFWSIGKILLLFCDPPINIDLLRTGEESLPGLESDFINEINDDKLREILHKCLSPDINRRYTQFMDLTKDFSELSGLSETCDTEDKGLGNFNFTNNNCYD